jgi:dsRNA-specific ribonuclease
MKTWRIWNSSWGIFRDADLLQRALTHSSHANEGMPVEATTSMEFLGDSILGFSSVIFFSGTSWSTEDSFQAEGLS